MSILLRCWNEMSVLSSGEAAARSDAALARLLIGIGGGRDVLDAGAGAVEQRDLVLALAPVLAPGDQLAELAMDIARAHRAGTDRVVEIAHHRALCADIGDHLRVRHQRRADLALPGIVGADRGDERARRDVVDIEEGYGGRGAGDDRLARACRRA